MSHPQTNVRLKPHEVAAIDAAGGNKSRYVHAAIAEKIERDAGGSPARVAMAPLVWQMIELALHYDLITPAELLAEARKYAGE